MADITHQMYSYYGDKYFTQKEAKSVVIPSGVDLTVDGVTTQINTVLSEAVVTLFNYYTDLTTKKNHERTQNMKDFLIDQIVTEMDDINTDFILGIGYELYNKDNKQIKASTAIVKATYSTAQVAEEVEEDDHMHYRKATVLDGTVIVDIPNIANYGVKNCCYQYPYTLRLTKLIVQATVGKSMKGFDCGCQMNEDTIGNGGTYACYAHHYECPNSQSDFSSHFITNRIGTTIIDQLVVPAVLEAPTDYEVVDIASIDLPASKYTFRFDSKLTKITMNMEVMVDNNLVVYDKAVIDQILEDNKERNDDDKEPDVEPDVNPEG